MTDSHLKNPGRHWPAVTMAALMAIACSHTATAQGAFGFMKDTVVAHFTQDDVNTMRSTGSEVLKAQDIGTSRSWSNPTTGNGGSLKLIGAFSSADGRECKKLRVENHTKTQHRVTAQTLCRSKDGPWLMDPDAKPPSESAAKPTQK